MKHTYILSLLLLFYSLSSYAQQDKFFDKFAEMEGVTGAYISKAMFDMMPNIKTNNLKLGDKVRKLESLRVFTSDKPKVITQMKKEANSFFSKNGYEELMRVNSEEERVNIYMKENKKNKKEFVLLKDSKEGFAILVITGFLTLEEIQEINGMAN